MSTGVESMQERGSVQLRRDSTGLAAGPVMRYVELPVSPLDSLVVARVVAIVALALTVGSFVDGPRELVLALLAVAALQPVLPIFWRSQGAYRQAQVVTDVVVFAAVVVLMPDYYWLSSIVLVAVVANHAVLSPIKHYVVASVLTVGAMATTGALLDIDQWQRVVAILVHSRCRSRVRRSSDPHVDARVQR